MLTRFQSIRFNSDTALVTTFGVLAALAFLISFRLENPFMMAAFSAAPLLLCLTWQRPFLMCVLFVAVSYFRLHEAYPFLGPVKLAFSFGALAVGLTAVKALLSRGRNDDVSSSAMLRSACIVSLALAAGLATLQSLTANVDGVSAGNVVLIPATVASSVMCAFFWFGFLNKAGPHEFPVNIRLFVAYFAVVSVTLVFGYIPAASFSVWTGTTLKIAAMTLAIAWMARTPRDFTIATQVFVMIGPAIAVVVIYNQIFGLDTIEGGRVTIGGMVRELQPADFKGGVLSDPNDLALILLFPLSFTLARLAYATTAFSAISAATTSGLIFWAITATKSRGALIGVVAVIGVLALLRFRGKSSAIVMAVVAGTLTFGAMGIGARMTTETYADSGLDDSAQIRLNAWHTALKMAANRPLTGVGIGNFPALYYSYTDYWDGRSRATHNMWLEVLAECGVIAFLLFIAMIVTSFKISLNSIKLLEAARAPPQLKSSAVALHAGLAGTCASGTFLSQAHTWPVFVSVALVAAMANLARDANRLADGDAPSTLDLPPVAIRMRNDVMGPAAPSPSPS